MLNFRVTYYELLVFYGDSRTTRKNANKSLYTNAKATSRSSDFLSPLYS